MIEGFRHKGLKELFESGRARRIRPNLQRRCRQMLDVLDAAETLSDINIHGAHLHPLKGPRPKRWSVWVSAQWRITFEWKRAGVMAIDLEQYH